MFAILHFQICPRNIVSSSRFHFLHFFEEIKTVYTNNLNCKQIQSELRIRVLTYGKMLCELKIKLRAHTSRDFIFTQPSMRLLHNCHVWKCWKLPRKNGNGTYRESNTAAPVQYSACRFTSTSRHLYFAQYLPSAPFAIFLLLLRTFFLRYRIYLYVRI